MCRGASLEPCDGKGRAPWNRSLKLAEASCSARREPEQEEETTVTWQRRRKHCSLSGAAESLSPGTLPTAFDGQAALFLGPWRLLHLQGRQWWAEPYPSTSSLSPPPG